MRLLILVAFASVIAGVIRLGALALEATGLDPRKARFQALSAFSGTGFTTSETELVVSHPQRRRIISTLIVVGNLGILGLLGAVVALVLSGVGSKGGLLWALALLAAVLLYGRVLSPRINPALKRALARLFGLLPVEVEELAQLSDGHAVFRLVVTQGSGLEGRSAADLRAAGVQVLAGAESGNLKAGDAVVCLGREEALAVIGASPSVIQAQLSPR